MDGRRGGGEHFVTFKVFNWHVGVNILSRGNDFASLMYCVAFSEVCLIEMP